jgi:hypothetical protein
MNEKEAQIVDLKALERMIDSALRPFVAGVLHPKLRDDKQLVTRQPASPDAVADSFFI